MFEIIVAIIIGLGFLLLCLGGLFMHMDAQAMWEVKQDYNKMQREVNKNDSSRIE